AVRKAGITFRRRLLLFQIAG
ncbi:TPA: hypothetical protein ACV5TA_002368, partial [Escherichia coli]